ncbi:PD40 domain-containing protein [Rhodanobacter sp. 7MK24]|uniref:PD40 domain-containing protein n=1 Tax=Rhodanobacter sp. 7MK24 TaxID=2775922 RepID=UPI0017876B92|nr:PD40 domain-containing protein [Rhodanobacter sp. 7MK24]MBD8879516.1 PD40 domain-containing protein [Rhodanobacter sp. 7MK24]
MSGSRCCMLCLALVVALGLNTATAATATAAPPALAAPQVFAPGIVSGPANDEAPTFSPDGNTLLFTRSGAGGGTIMESHRVDGHWSAPVMASFSGAWPDLAPEFSPDGRYVIYVSIHRIDSTPAHNQVGLWRVDRAGNDGWSKPRRLPDAVNISDAVWKASMTRDGSIYFLSIDPGKGKRLYVSHYAHGAYQPAQPLPFSHYGDNDVDPEIAPDGSYMVFASDHRLPGDSKDHLFIVFRQGDGWDTPQAIRYEGDDAPGFSTDYLPHLGPDQRTLYFTSDRSMPVAHYPHTPAQAAEYLQRIEQWDNGNLNAWSVSLTPLLEAHRNAG